MKAASGPNVRVSLPKAFHSARKQSHKVFVKGVSTNIKQEEFENMNETFLKLHTNFSLPGYDIKRNDRTLSAIGDLGLFVQGKCHSLPGGGGGGGRLWKFLKFCKLLVIPLLYE